MSYDQRVGSLPMYFTGQVKVSRFWHALAKLLRDKGLHGVPPDLQWPQDLVPHWQSPDLLLSQACGYPLVTALEGQVQVLGTFLYGAPGCQGTTCRSQIVVRQADAKASLQEFAGRTVAYNATDSQSGFNSLRSLIAPLAQQGRFFGHHIETGGHLRSIDSVREGHADIAAIDCVTLAGVLQDQPEQLNGVVVWGETAAYTGLPLITSASTPANEVALLREVLEQISRAPQWRSICEPLLIEGFVPLNTRDYQVCIDMRDQARALGVETL